MDGAMFQKPTTFTYSVAIGEQRGVTRRDPSPVICVDGVYHVWYTKNLEANPHHIGGFTGSVWHATSPDGHHWREEAEAISKGAAGSFDECGVYTPTILVYEQAYYLYYTAMPLKWLDDTRNTQGAIAVARSESPYGPWEKQLGEPVLRCSNDPNAFDSVRVDDSCIVVRDDGLWMYYKGKRLGTTYKETQMGLARATHPLGPWVKHEANPIINSGHEVCVWPHGPGIACLVTNTGPQANTLQYSADGITFTPVQQAFAPGAPGPFRSDHYQPTSHGRGVEWGLCMQKEDKCEWPYLLRFEANLSHHAPTGE
jgi:beta-xylosidase